MSSSCEMCYVEVCETVLTGRKCEHTENVLAGRLLLQGLLRDVSASPNK